MGEVRGEVDSGQGCSLASLSNTCFWDLKGVGFSLGHARQSLWP